MLLCSCKDMNQTQFNRFVGYLTCCATALLVHTSDMLLSARRAWQESFQNFFYVFYALVSMIHCREALGSLWVLPLVSLFVGSLNNSMTSGALLAADEAITSMTSLPLAAVFLASKMPMLWTPSESAQ